MDIRSHRQKGLSYVESGKKHHIDPRTAKRYAESPQKPGRMNGGFLFKTNRELTKAIEKRARDFNGPAAGPEFRIALQLLSSAPLLAPHISRDPYSGLPGLPED